MPKSSQCWTTPDRMTAPSIIRGMGPQKYVSSFRSGLSFFAAISLGPSLVSRLAASACVRPSGEDPSFCSTSAMGSVFSSFLGSAGASGLVPGCAAAGLGREVGSVMKASVCSDGQR